MTHRFRPFLFAASAAALALGAAPLPAASFLIQGAQVADGTGAPLKTEDVRVEGDTIAVGKLAPRPGERVVDGRGLVLAPGFIDVHNHSIEELVNRPAGIEKFAPCPE